MDSDYNKIGNRNQNLRSLAKSVESLTKWTIKNKSRFSIPFDEKVTRNPNGLQFDLILCSDKKSSAIIAEIKYYSDILKMIVRDYYALIGRFLTFQKENPSMKYHFYMMFFTDSVKKEDRDRLLIRINELRNNTIMEDIDLNIFIVSIANLKEDMDAVINSINSKD